MTDQPRPDADDATSSFSPPPSGRPRWVDQGWGTPTGGAGGGHPAPSAGAPTWYEPAGPAGGPRGSVGPGHSPDAHRGTSSAAAGRGVGLASVAGIAVLAGVVGALLTVGILGVGGFLGAPGTTTDLTPMAPTSDTMVVTRIEQSDIIAAVNRVSPAVVTITTRTAMPDGSPSDPLAVAATGVGSGIIFSSDQPLALTARHVVCGGDALTVRLLDGREFAATVYGVDTLTDLAVVRIDSGGQDLPVARMGDSSALQPGQVSIAIGSPMGTHAASVTSGVISALGRDVSVTERCQGDRHVLHSLIQTDARINRGNSGGPLIDATGRVIGVSTVEAGGGGEGVGFAVPINIARPIMDQAIAGLALSRPWIGIQSQPVTPALVTRLDLPVDYGVLVDQPADSLDPAVTPGGPAARAGILDGDVITAIDEERIDASHPLDDLLAQYRADDTLVLSILRDGHTFTVRVTLGTRPAGP